MKTGTAPLLAAAIMMIVACGKKEDGASHQPDLSAPVNIVPQVEVKASSGPVELALFLHKTQIKAGDYLWQQIRLRNIGDKMFVLADQVFHNPRDLREASASGYGIYLEAIGPDGKRLKVEYNRGRPAPPKDDGVSGLLEVEGHEERAMLDGWRKQGLSPTEIDRKLLDYNVRKRITDETLQQPIIKLAPGESAETKSAFFYSLKDEMNGKPRPQPIGSFAQIDFFHFDKPGQYKVRAIFDHQPRELARKYKSLNSPADVLIRTPWIEVTVLP